MLTASEILDHVLTRRSLLTHLMMLPYMSMLFLWLLLYVIVCAQVKARPLPDMSMPGFRVVPSEKPLTETKEFDLAGNDLHRLAEAQLLAKVSTDLQFICVLISRSWLSDQYKSTTSMLDHSNNLIVACARGREHVTVCHSCPVTQHHLLSSRSSMVCMHARPACCLTMSSIHTASIAIAAVAAVMSD